MTRYTKYKKSHNSADITSSLSRSSHSKSRVEYNPLSSRNDNRHKHKVCLRCRKRGHSLESCKEQINEPTDKNVKVASGTGTGMCYRCGSVEHTLANCPKPTPKGNTLPFAKCFMCGGVGHLVRDCEKNEKGLYPKGGSCHHCGSIRHFARDCEERKKLFATREHQKLKNREDMELSENVKEPAGDEDDLLANLRQKVSRKKNSRGKDMEKKTKVVTF